MYKNSIYFTLLFCFLIFPLLFTCFLSEPMSIAKSMPSSKSVQINSPHESFSTSFFLSSSTSYKSLFKDNSTHYYYLSTPSVSSHTNGIKGKSGTVNQITLRITCPYKIALQVQFYDFYGNSQFLTSLSPSTSDTTNFQLKVKPSSRYYLRLSLSPQKPVNPAAFYQLSYTFSFSKKNRPKKHASSSKKPKKKVIRKIIHSHTKPHKTHIKSSTKNKQIPIPKIKHLSTVHFLRIKQGQRATLSVQHNPKNAIPRSLVWQSSNPKIVSVSSGRLCCHKKGVAVITVMLSSNHSIRSSSTIRVY